MDGDVYNEETEVKKQIVGFYDLQRTKRLDTTGG